MSDRGFDHVRFACFRSLSSSFPAFVMRHRLRLCLANPNSLENENRVLREMSPYFGETSIVTIKFCSTLRKNIYFLADCYFYNRLFNCCWDNSSRRIKTSRSAIDTLTLRDPAIKIRPMDIGKKVTSLKMLIGVARGWPCVFADRMAAPTRGTSVLANTEHLRSDLTMFNKYKCLIHLAVSSQRFLDRGNFISECHYIV